MTETEKLEVAHQIAGAALGVVEETRWAIAALSTFLLKSAYFDSWLIPIVVGIVLVFVIPYWHSKRYDQTWDAYERATGTGKYYRPPIDNDG